MKRRTAAQITRRGTGEWIPTLCEICGGESNQDGTCSDACDEIKELRAEIGRLKEELRKIAGILTDCFIEDSQTGDPVELARMASREIQNLRSRLDAAVEPGSEEAIALIELLVKYTTGWDDLHVSLKSEIVAKLRGDGE